MAGVARLPVLSLLAGNWRAPNSRRVHERLCSSPYLTDQFKRKLCGLVPLRETPAIGGLFAMMRVSGRVSGSTAPRQMQAYLGRPSRCAGTALPYFETSLDGVPRLTVSGSGLSCWCGRGLVYSHGDGGASDGGAARSTVQRKSSRTPCSCQSIDRRVSCSNRLAAILDWLPPVEDGRNAVRGEISKANKPSDPGFAHPLPRSEVVGIGAVIQDQLIAQRAGACDKSDQRRVRACRLILTLHNQCHFDPMVEPHNH